jgi:magnesium-transporting ATPase (P-type)
VLGPGGGGRQRLCKDLRLGDLALVKKGEYFPADLLLLASSEARPAWTKYCLPYECAI